MRKNLLLALFARKGKIFGFEANPGWRVLQKQQGFSGWQELFEKIRTDLSTKGTGGA